jgi:hypothetical protein
MYTAWMPVYRKVNKSFFKKWSPEMAYVLGFFAADGYMTLNRRGANFWCIQITDKKLLESIKRIIEADHAISLRHRRGNEKNLYRLQVGSKDMCNDLRRLGFSERKTKNLSIPRVPTRYLGPFVRGYFDGDGNVWCGRAHKERRTAQYMLMTMFTSGSRRFLQDLHSRLLSRCVRGGYLYTSKKSYFRLQFATRDSLKLYDFMYNGSDPIPQGLYLARKKGVFERYKKLRP